MRGGQDGLPTHDRGPKTETALMDRPVGDQSAALIWQCSQLGSEEVSDFDQNLINLCGPGNLLSRQSLYYGLRSY